MEDSIRSVTKLLDGAIRYEGDSVQVVRPQALASEAMDRLVEVAVFATNPAD